jgi:stearoyl-CoA desaturase (Delta-9 desaturase)
VTGGNLARSLQAFKDFCHGLLGLVWGGVLRVCFVHHITSSINSICHLVGSRPFSTPEQSTNFALLAIPTFGEAWHNNHHAFQGSASFQLRWWQLDPGYWIILLAEKLGIVWDVRRPSRDRVNVKMAASQAKEVPR